MMRKRISDTFLTVLTILFLVCAFLTGCADIEGELDENQHPTVGFVTVPLDSSVFSFAPVIYWTGNDPDGFVEYYSYADVTDSGAILDPIAYYSQIPEDAWVDTIATEARIFLLTDAGERTEHVFYVRCYDNEGAASESIKFRTFFRTNQAPDTPLIGVTGADESELDVNVYVLDTLFCGTDITSSWGGLQFTWRASDPDDKALYKIPLQYQPILVKAPNDTIFVREWQDDQDIVLVDLETGFYSLYVWVRDDALTLSAAPARIEFNVIRPTFEHNILLVIEAPIRGPLAYPAFDSLTNDLGTGFYDRLIPDVAASVHNANLVLDGENVKVIMTDASDTTEVIPKALIHQYKLVIFAVDQAVKLSSSYGTWYTTYRNKVLVEYLRVGGRLWFQGRTLGETVIGAQDHPEYGDLTGILLEEFLTAENIAFYPSNWSFPTQIKAHADFVGTIPALEDYPALQFDTTRESENWYEYADTLLDRGMTGANLIERGSTAITTQYFNSHTSTYTAEVDSEDCVILDEVVLGGIPVNNPATQTECYIQTLNPNVIPEEVTRVVNITRMRDPNSNWRGEVKTVNNDVIQVGYEQGEPWFDSDTLEVDYKYDPISFMHLKPVEVIHEEMEFTSFVLSELRYRTALTTFSYYYMNYDGALEAWTIMIDWLLNPEINR
ncbi:MAG: hypothetical protein P9L92_02495 [Candidatus Electryonea clarkiae]|nr:hypothetical protein [Candidatus Electryonea clarkiae]MDP8285864.1 hypothetical protein [Candidatus Electryonea clarkiae]